MYKDIENSFTKERICFYCRQKYRLIDCICNYQCQNHTKTYYINKNEKLHSCCFSEVPCVKSIHTDDEYFFTKNKNINVPLYIIEKYKPKLISDKITFHLVDEKGNKISKEEKHKIDKYQSYITCDILAEKK